MVELVVLDAFGRLPAHLLLVVVHVDQAPASGASASMRVPLRQVRRNQRRVILQPLDPNPNALRQSLAPFRGRVVAEVAL